MKKQIVAFPDDDFALGVYKILEDRNFDLNSIYRHNFPDKEFKIKITKNVRKHECFFIHDSNHNPSEWWVELHQVSEALYNSSADEITVVLPYLRFSRQDRKDESRVPQSAKAVADIVKLYANRALTIDVHSPQIGPTYDIFDNLYSYFIVIDHLKKYHPNILEDLVVISPDAGGTKRVEAFRKRLLYRGFDSDSAFGHKSKSKEGEVVEFKLAGDVRGKNAFLL